MSIPRFQSHQSCNTVIVLSSQNHKLIPRTKTIKRCTKQATADCDASSTHDEFLLSRRNSTDPVHWNVYQTSDKSLFKDVMMQWNTRLGRVDSDLGCHCVAENGRLHLPAWDRLVCQQFNIVKQPRFLTGDKVTNVVFSVLTSGKLYLANVCYKIVVAMITTLHSLSNFFLIPYSLLLIFTPSSSW